MTCHPLDGIYKTKVEYLISKHSTKSYHRRILFTDFSSYPQESYLQTFLHTLSEHASPYISFIRKHIFSLIHAYHALAISLFLVYTKHIKRASAHKVEALKLRFYVFSDAPILLADRVGIFLFPVMPIYVGQ